MTIRTIPLPEDAKELLEEYASFRRSRLAYVALWFSVWATSLGGVLGFLVYRIFQPCRGCALRPDPEHWPYGAAIALAFAAPVLWIVARALPAMWAERRNWALTARADLAAGTAEPFELEIGENFRLIQPGEDEPSKEPTSALIVAPLDTRRTIVLSLEDLESREPHQLDAAIAKSWRGIVLPNLRLLWNVESSGAPLSRQNMLHDEEFTALDMLDDPGIEHAFGWVITKPFGEVAAAIDKVLTRTPKTVTETGRFEAMA